jgi:uncharacterized iron-regulated protein
MSMNRLIILVAALTFLMKEAGAQHKEAYRIFTNQGKPVSYGRMVKQVAGKDIVLFGEYHNNAIAHWLQLELTRDLGDKRRLVLGAEMFEADNQEGLNRYLSGAIDAKEFAKEVRLWRNYSTDYAPLVNYAKEKKLSFIATNIPRPFAAAVSKGGFEVLDTLNEKSKQWVAPLPVAYDPELPGYKNMMQMMGGHASPNMPKAQAIKDATMAHFILKHFQQGQLFLHFNGTYHSDNYEGILWYLKRQQPSLRYGTIATVTQKDIRKLQAEHIGKADFIICVDEDVTTTY